MEMEGREQLTQADVKDSFVDSIAGWAEEEKEYKNNIKYVWTDLARERMDYYIDCCENSTSIDVKFSVVSRNGYLFAYDNGIKIIMNWHALENSLGAQLMRDNKGKAAVLDKIITVKVTSYVEDGLYGPVVYVSQKRTFNDRKHEAEKMINKAIEDKTKILFPAKVVCVLESLSVVVIDIGGYGIKGFCKFNDWSELASGISKPWLATPGSIIYVRVEGRLHKKRKEVGVSNHSMIAGGYRCVRAGGAYYIGKRFEVGEEVVCSLLQNTEWGGFATIDIGPDATVMIRGKRRGIRWGCYIKYIVEITGLLDDKNSRVKYTGRIISKVENEE